MCQSKIQGGQRCESHARQNVHKIEDRIYRKVMSGLSAFDQNHIATNTPSEDQQRNAMALAVNEAHVRPKYEEWASQAYIQQARVQVLTEQLHGDHDGFLMNTDEKYRALDEQAESDPQNARGIRAKQAQMRTALVQDMKTANVAFTVSGVPSQTARNFIDNAYSKTADGQKLAETKQAMDAVYQPAFTRALQFEKANNNPAYHFAAYQYASTPAGEQEFKKLAEARMEHELAIQRSSATKKSIERMDDGPDKDRLMERNKKYNQMDKVIAAGTKAQAALQGGYYNSAKATIPSDGMPLRTKTIISPSRAADIITHAKSEGYASKSDTDREVLSARSLIAQDDPELKGYLEKEAARGAEARDKLLRLYEEKALQV